MNTRRLNRPRARLGFAAPLLACVLLASLHVSAGAQQAAPAPELAPSQAPVSKSTKLAKPGPRPLTQSDRRGEIAPHDDSRPEGTVTPQLKIPLGPEQTPTLKPVPRSGSRAKSSVNDTAARCEAIVDPVERKACKEGATR